MKHLLLMLVMFMVSNHMNSSIISVLSWNILGPATRDVERFGFVQGDYSRLEKTIAVIQQYQADIICLQEVDKISLHYLNHILLCDYHCVAYQEKGLHGGVVVYAKRLLFEVEKTFECSLSSGDKNKPGALAGGVLTHVDKIPLFIGSIHFSRSHDRRSMNSGKMQIEAIYEALRDSLPQQIIFAGDFNTLYEEMLYESLPFMNILWPISFNLFSHQSFTANRSDGNFLSIDHVMFSHIKLIEKDSMVGNRDYIHKAVLVTREIMKHELFQLVQKVVPSDHLPMFVLFDIDFYIKQEKIEQRGDSMFLNYGAGVKKVNK